MATDTDRAPRGDDPARGLGPTRARVLALLQDAGGPIAAVDAADRLGLHPNSVRFHLDALADEGLVDREPQQRSGRGRPRMLYGPAPSAPRAAHRSYRFLAEALSTVLSEALPDPAGVAEGAGRAWGRRLTADGSRVEGEVVDALVRSLERVGFESHATPGAERRRLEITHCPFLEVAAGRQDVVCALHLGLLRGAAEQLGGSVTVQGLDPLVAPGLCVARLGSRQPRKPATSARAARASGTGSSG